jgi:hypothetical protein
LPLLLAIFCLVAASVVRAVELQISFDHPAPAGAVTIASEGTLAQLYVESEDIQPTGIAAGLLAEDVQRVTGRQPQTVNQQSALSGDAVLIGTIGHCKLIDRLASEGKIDLSDLRGKWEAYKLAVIEKPLPNVPRALVIAGSDRRGTAYGALTLSNAIGVSPWYWWADVPIARHSNIVVLPTTLTDSPVVKYRGIFLNDEAPCLTGWTDEKFGGYNHTFYVKVFELLLRLKANYLWPAMWNNCFNEDDPLNPRLANDYGIVMGTSHVEPLMRADKEWNRKGYTAAQWNYDKSPRELLAFWKEGLERNKPYENIITIAMRGKIDTPMSETANIALLERIVTDQRKLIADVIDPDVTKVPQLWALYKEVQEYYEKGMRVPDDVTLLWCDDNWGNIRRLPTPEERNRAGGAGIYYHFDYVGGPRNYKWLNTVPITKTWEQMNLAHNYGADRIWIVNVGDLKPMEFPIDFFMNMAWNPDRMSIDRLAGFGRDWATRLFGPAHADDIADIIAKYTRYNGRRKPELIDPATFSLTSWQEADRVVADWQAIVARAEEIYKDLPEESRDAFYQLVLHPTKASAVVTELYIAAGRNHLYASQGRSGTNDVAAQVRALFKEDADLSDYFNHTLAHGKWSHMMDQTHIGYTNWQQPPQNNMPAVKEIQAPQSASMGVAVEGSTAAWPSDAASSQSPTLPTFDGFARQRRPIDVFNRGHDSFTFTAVPSASWIQLSVANGAVDKEQRLWVTIDWDKVPQGTADGTITISSDAAKQPVIVSIHAFNPAEPTRDSLNGFVESDGCVSMEAEHFTARHDAGPIHWGKIDDFGRTLSAMTLFPVTAPSVSPPQGSPCLEYRIYLFQAGPVNVEAILAPTLNFVPGRGLRYAVSFDDQPPQVVDALAHNTQRDWEESVRDAVRKVRTSHTLDKAGYHTLKFWMVDPGVVLEKLVIDHGNLPPSYLGPPESFHHAAMSN